MYCVKCGRLAREGEKRCPRCGTRLVTPERLERLLEEDIRRRKAAKGRKAGFLKSTALFAKRFCESAADVIYDIAEKSGPAVRSLRKRLRRLRRRLTDKLQLITETVAERISDVRNPKGRKRRKRVNTQARRTKPRKNYSYTEKNLRSIVAMTLLAVTIAVLLMWGVFSEAGMRTFAGFGMGSAKGYILLGDEYMSSANYLRAVESYYTALEKNGSYDAAYRLARAYSYTGDLDKCVSALLYCTDNYPGRREPYEQLAAIYPDAASRPDTIRQALIKGNAQFGIQ